MRKYDTYSILFYVDMDTGIETSVFHGMVKPYNSVLKCLSYTQSRASVMVF